MIEDHRDVYHIPMTDMVLEICSKIHTSDFSTLIVCGTVVLLAARRFAGYLQKYGQQIRN